MGLGDRLIDGERALGVLPGAHEPLVHRHAPVIHVERVRVRQAGVRECITGIGSDCLLEEVDRLGDALARPLVPCVAAAQIEPIRRDAFGVALLARRAIAEGLRP